MLIRGAGGGSNYFPPSFKVFAPKVINFIRKLLRDNDDYDGGKWDAPYYHPCKHADRINTGPPLLGRNL